MDYAGVTQFYRPANVTVTYTRTYNGRTYSGSYTSVRWKTNDMDGWEICCWDQNRKPGDCELYYNFRRIALTRCFIPRFLAWLRGDPHFTTVDNHTYTFNGHGEYVLAKTPSVEIQVRTARITTEVDDQTVLGNATKFSGMAIKPEGSQTLQFQLVDPHDENTAMLMFVDGQLIDLTQNQESEASYGTASVRINSERSVHVSLEEGWSIDVQASRGLMLFLVSIPDDQRGNVVGLIGTFNNDTEDDFRRPDGTDLPLNSSAQDIHYRFGQKWATNSSTTLFTYFGGDTWETFNDPDFVPYFRPEVLDPDDAPFCEGDEQCIYDYLATGNRDIALDTLNANKNVERNTQIMANNAPTLTVTNGTSVTLQTDVSAYIIVETDPGDTATVEKAPGTYNTGCLTISGKKVTIDTTNTIDLRECDIALIAIDSNGVSSAITQVTIVECPVCVNGYCDHDTAKRPDGSTNAYYKTASCTCRLAWTGPTCSEKVNLCDPNPCGDRECEQMTDAEIAQDENSRGYRCKCGLEDISIRGQCLIPLPVSENETAVIVEDEDGLSRGLIIVITVCVIVVTIGVGVLVLYLVALHHKQASIHQRLNPSPPSSGGAPYAPRMNLTGWWAGGNGYGWNPANPNPYRTPRPYEHRPQPQYQPRPQYGQNLGRGWSWTPSNRAKRPQ